MSGRARRSGFFRVASGVLLGAVAAAPLVPVACSRAAPPRATLPARGDAEGDLGAESREAASGDRVVGVAALDPDMLAAIAKARATLPDFWRAFEHPGAGEEGFALKVKITDEAGVEHFWAGGLERRDGAVFGVIANEPDTVRSVKEGQRIKIPDADVSDWMYVRGGKIVGNYTLRAALKTLPPEEAEQYRAELADP